MAWLVSIIGAATYTAYVIALILPLVYPYCPYKVPTTLYGHRLYQFVRDYLILRIALSLSPLVSPRLLFHLSMYHKRHADFIHSRQKCRTLMEIEHNHVRKCAAKVDEMNAQGIKDELAIVRRPRRKWRPPTARFLSTSRLNLIPSKSTVVTMEGRRKDIRKRYTRSRILIYNIPCCGLRFEQVDVEHLIRNA